MSEMTFIDPAEVSTSACEGHNDTLTILSGPYEGLKFRYDAVWFDDKNPQLGLQFHYKLLNGALEDPKDFEHAIAHLLHNQMKKTLSEAGIVFRGGIDPTREEFMEHLESKLSQPVIEFPDAPQKNLAQQIMQAPGVFQAKEKESAMSFLDRLAAQGQAEMGKQ